MQDDMLQSDDGNRRHFSPRVKSSLWRLMTECVITKSLNLQPLFLYPSLSVCVCVCAWFDRVKLPFRKMYHGKVTLQLLLLDISHTVKKSGGKRGKKSLRTLKTNKQKKGYLTLGYLAYSLRRIKTI